MSTTRKYNFYDTSVEIDSGFKFLITDYSYDLTEKRQERYGYITRYENGDRKVYLYYDYKENFFYFNLIRGKNTVYPNDFNQKNIKPFFRLFEKHEPGIDLNKLQPNDDQYMIALKLNVELLKKYGDGVLKGKEWV